MGEAGGLGEQGAEDSDGERAAELAARVEHPAGGAGDASGTLLSSTAVTGGMINGPASPTGSISTATVTGLGGRRAWWPGRRARRHQGESGDDDARAPKRSAMRALNGVRTAPMSIIGRNTSPVWNADRPWVCWRYRLITNGSP